MKTKYIRRTVVLAAAVIIALAAVRMRISASVQEDLREQVLRFHVRANSDSAEDQREKLMVRDAVIDYVSPYMEQAETKEEAAEILKKKRKKYDGLPPGFWNVRGTPGR